MHPMQCSNSEAKLPLCNANINSQAKRLVLLTVHLFKVYHYKDIIVFIFIERINQFLQLAA